MSIWISRAGLTIAATLVLSACVPAEFGAASGGTRAMAVSDGAVTVAGPAGYCIDRTASRDGADGAFVLFGTCAALSGGRGAAQPARPAVLTASVSRGAPEDGSLPDSFASMTAFFRSAPGRAALSRSGRADTVEVAEAVRAGDVLYLRLNDRSAATGQAVEPEYWRAILALRGRMVTLSALGLSDRPLSSAEKRRVLEAMVARMRASNAGAE